MKKGRIKKNEKELKEIRLKKSRKNIHEFPLKVARAQQSTERPRQELKKNDIHKHITLTGPRHLYAAVPKTGTRSQKIIAKLSNLNSGAKKIH